MASQPVAIVNPFWSSVWWRNSCLLGRVSFLLFVSCLCCQLVSSSFVCVALFLQFWRCVCYRSELIQVKIFQSRLILNFFSLVTNEIEDQPGINLDLILTSNMTFVRHGFLFITLNNYYLSLFLGDVNSSNA